MCLVNVRWKCSRQLWMSSKQESVISEMIIASRIVWPNRILAKRSSFGQRKKCAIFQGLQTKTEFKKSRNFKGREFVHALIVHKHILDSAMQAFDVLKLSCWRNKFWWWVSLAQNNVLLRNWKTSSWPRPRHRTRINSALRCVACVGAGLL